MRAPARFLTAEWRHLVMLNYALEPAVLAPLVPAGTTLDRYDGRTYASLVAFLFLRTKVLGVPVPLHRDFEEVNLRFYVRRETGAESRRGVVFVREIVPRPAIALLARLLYHERYAALPMRHEIAMPELEYGWRFRGRWNSLRVRVAGEARPSMAGSLEEFVTEHYWGYARQRDGGCVEYRVEHPRWNVWRASEVALDCDVAALYGPEFAAALGGSPASAFVADGSAVTVYAGRRIA